MANIFMHYEHSLEEADWSVWGWWIAACIVALIGLYALGTGGEISNVTGIGPGSTLVP